MLCQCLYCRLCLTQGLLLVLREDFQERERFSKKSEAHFEFLEIRFLENLEECFAYSTVICVAVQLH